MMAANMVARTAQHPRAPYIIGTDFNVDPLDSEVLALAVTNKLLHDLPTDWCEGRTPPTTFLKEGAHQGMEVGTRIDTILTNYISSHGCTAFHYGWKRNWSARCRCVCLPPYLGTPLL